MKLTYTKTVLLSKLHDELLATGVIVAGRDRVEGKPDGTEVTCSEAYIYIPDDTPQEVIDQIGTIVNAHDPTPLPYQPTVEEQIMLALTDAQLKIADQQELISNQQQLIDQLALAITDLQLQGGTAQ